MGNTRAHGARAVGGVGNRMGNMRHRTSVEPELSGFRYVDERAFAYNLREADRLRTVLGRSRRCSRPEADLRRGHWPERLAPSGDLAQASEICRHLPAKRWRLAASSLQELLAVHY